MKDKKEVIEFIKREENIEWLEAFVKVVKSHIDLLKCMEVIEKNNNCWNCFDNAKCPTVIKNATLLYENAKR